MMRVGYDDQALLAQRRGGVSRYVLSLVGVFGAAPELGVEPVTAWRFSTNEHALAAGVARGIGPLDRHRRGFDPISAGACFALNSAGRRRARGADLLHQTFYHPRFLEKRGSRPSVVTVYDMIPELFPELFDRNPHLAKAEYIRQSDLVIAISESAAADLVRVYGEIAAPIVVTPLGVDPVFRPGVRALSDLPPRYQLFVGRRDGYKNFGVVIAALASDASNSDPLVAVGGGPFSVEEHRLLARYGLGGRVIQRDLPEVALPAAYANASVFIFPSQYEGFGLPTLEAMASGTPTLLAAASSLPEVGGSAARYFDPTDSSALADLLRWIDNDPGGAADLGARGLARASEFTWRRTAELTGLAYRQLLPDAA